MNSFIKDFTKYEISNYGYVRLPNIEISKELKESVGLKENASDLEFCTALARQGWKERCKHVKKEDYKKYADRIKYEIDLLDELGFIPYMLLVWMIINKARELGVFIDYGRGSVGGSVLAWLLKITGAPVDPIKHGLFFERFVSRARAGKKIINNEVFLKGDLLADIDINLGNGRESILNWLREIYPNRISKICNISTLTTKILLKDVYKNLEEAGESEAKRVSDLIDVKFGVAQTIEEAYGTNNDFKIWVDQHQDTVKVCKKLSGLMKQLSSHASGYLVGHYELTDSIPVEINKEGDITSSYDMSQVSSFATKIDLLSLTTNAIIKNVFDNIPEKIEDIDPLLDDNGFIYDKFQNGGLLPYGLYQISADCAYGVLNVTKPKNINELSDLNALARPGGLAAVKPYHDNNAKSPHPVFDSILKTTRQLPLYQEQLMKMSVAVGFTNEESEIIRKIVGKKDLVKVKEWESKIYKKCEENGFEKPVADVLWKLLNESASYSFNLAHSISTSYLSALTVYLKYKYPLQFYCACLIATKDLADPIGEVALIQKELKSFNIELLSPDILKSEPNYTIVDGNILIGISGIKGISDKALEKLRTFKSTTKNKFDLFSSLSDSKIPLGVSSALILSGCFDSIANGAKRSKLLLELEVFKLLTTKELNFILSIGEKYNYDLLSIIKDMAESLKDEKGKPIIKESRFATIKRDYEPYKQKYLANSKHEMLSAYIFENNYLGFSYSTTLKKIYSAHCVDLSSLSEITPDDVLDTKFRCAVQVVELENRISKEKKTKYLSLLVKDDTGTQKMMLFGEDRLEAVRQCNGRDIKEGDIIIVNGTRKKKSDAHFLDTISIQSNPVVIRVSELADKELSQL